MQFPLVTWNRLEKQSPRQKHPARESNLVDTRPKPSTMAGSEMNNLKNIFRFGWPYLKRYKGRLITGILLGFLFGASNASFFWATKTLFTRLSPPPTAEQIAAQKLVDEKKSPSAFKDEAKRIQQSAEN